MSFHIHIRLHNLLPALNITMIIGKELNSEDFTMEKRRFVTYYVFKKCSLCQNRDKKHEALSI